MNSYGDFAKHYIDKGISVIPDKWESKRPAINGWTDYCRRMPTQDEVREWSEIGNTNIAVACGEASGVIALDLDTEDTQLLDIIRDFMPESPVERIGSKGWVRFFRYNGEHSEAIKHDGKIVFEILSNNKKCTIPPSKHPDGMVYKWKGADLLNTDINKLPYLPPMFLTNIKHVLKCASPSTTFDGNKIINGRFDALQSECGKLIKEGLPLDDAIKKLIEVDEETHEEPYFSDSSEHYHTEPFTNALKMYTSCLDSFNKRHMERSEEYEVPITKSAVDEEYRELVLKKKRTPKGKQRKRKRSFND